MARYIVRVESSSFILAPLLKILSHAPKQIRLSLPRGDRPLEQPRFRVDRNIADGIVGVVMEDLIPLHTLPVLPTPEVKMHDITRHTGQRASHQSKTLSHPIAVMLLPCCSVLETLRQFLLPLPSQKHGRIAATDGVPVIATSEPHITAPDDVAHCKELMGVERGFRHLKDVIALRAIHHRSANRIEAHIFVATLALLLERLLERRLKDARVDLSAPAAWEAVSTIRLGSEV